MRKTGVIRALLIITLLVLAVRCTAGDLEQARREMVEQLRSYGITNNTVLKAMGSVKRHLFIPKMYRALTNPYGDHACPIGFGQTISQPFIVAYMTQYIDPHPGEKILEIGTGSGYQAAVLAEICKEIYTIEIIPQLAEHARQVLKEQGYQNVHVLTGDGYHGWPEHAPFDSIIITCAPRKIPQALVNQLAEEGRMILPVGNKGYTQKLVTLKKTKDGLEIQDKLPVRFVPMVHEKYEQE